MNIMKHKKIFITLGCIVAVLTVGWTMPRLKPHQGNLSSAQLQEMLAETSIAFDAPLLELAALPTYRVQNVNGSNITIGIYGWFGWHVANVHYGHCGRQEGLINADFACQGGNVEYL